MLTPVPPPAPRGNCYETPLVAGRFHKNLLHLARERERALSSSSSRAHKARRATRARVSSNARSTVLFKCSIGDSRAHFRARSYANTSGPSAHRNFRARWKFRTDPGSAPLSCPPALSRSRRLPEVPTKAKLLNLLV